MTQPGDVISAPAPACGECGVMRAPIIGKVIISGKLLLAGQAPQVTPCPVCALLRAAHLHTIEQTEPTQPPPPEDE